MPFISTRPKLILEPSIRSRLESLSRSRTESLTLIERSKILLFYSSDKTVSWIAKELHTNRPKVERCINKALELGALNALKDIQRSGKPPDITPEACAWLTSLACQKPKDIGYSYELWTTALLAKHIRENCQRFGHPCFSKLARGTVSKLLSKAEIKPHKISYYLERKDEQFDQKMAQVLCVYKEVELLQKGNSENTLEAYLSYDEKPGIQAIENIAPDLPPEPGEHATISRDYEYKRHGTLSLMAGIDLMTGEVIAQVKERHRSREFIEFLDVIDKTYPEEIKINIVLDNHSAHISKETRAYLETVPNRFEFVFTPKHGSWLNLIETFFSKMARTFLRGIRVSSKQELKERIEQYIGEINQAPVVFKWKYKMDSTQII